MLIQVAVILLFSFYLVLFRAERGRLYDGIFIAITYLVILVSISSGFVGMNACSNEMLRLNIRSAP
jgi:hypothetical protein